MKVTIIGAGIVGVTTAYFAYKKGHDVFVIDPEGIANKCSYANGGQVSVCNSQVWNTWGNIQKAMLWLGQENAPLLVRPDFDLDRIKWLTKFFKEVLTNTSDKNTSKTIILGLKSRKLYAEMFQEVDGLERLADIEYNGILHVYTEPKDYQDALAKVKFFTDRGVEWQDIKASGITKIEPSLLSYSKNIVGGIFTPSDFTGDIHRFCIHLLTWLQSKGVKFDHLSALNSKQDLDKHPSDVYVFCTGSNLGKHAAWYEKNLYIYPVKGYSLTIMAPPNHIPKVSILDEHAKIVTSKLGNKFRIAGTAEFTGHDESINPNRLKPLYEWVNSNFSHIDTSKAEEWSCLRPMRPNMLPIVGKFTNNIFYNGGHGHLGWTLAPATAQHLVEIL